MSFTTTTTMSIRARATARYKNQDGSLALTSVSLEWTKHPTGGGSAVGQVKPVLPDLTIAVRDVKVHAVSAVTSKRLLLKVVTASRDPKAAGYVFEFNAKLNAKAEREAPLFTLLSSVPRTVDTRTFLSRYSWMP